MEHVLREGAFMYNLMTVCPIGTHSLVEIRNDLYTVEAKPSLVRKERSLQNRSPYHGDIIHRCHGGPSPSVIICGPVERFGMLKWDVISVSDRLGRCCCSPHEGPKLVKS